MLEIAFTWSHIANSITMLEATLAPEYWLYPPRCGEQELVHSGTQQSHHHTLVWISISPLFTTTYQTGTNELPLLIRRPHHHNANEALLLILRPHHHTDLIEPHLLILQSHHYTDTNERLPLVQHHTTTFCIKQHLYHLGTRIIRDIRSLETSYHITSWSETSIWSHEGLVCD